MFDILAAVGSIQTLFNNKRPLLEWVCWLEDKYDIYIQDPDGFDRRDGKMWERYYTKKEFLEALPLCTIAFLSPRDGSEPKWPVLDDLR